MKKKYVPPTLEVFQYKVEHGFAQSAQAEPDYMLMDVSDSLENVKEGHNYNLFGDDNWY